MDLKLNSSQPTDFSYQDYEPEDYAAIYARKSIKSENNSIVSQIARAKEVLYEQNLLLYRVYTDEESATKLHYKKRKGFSELLRAAEEGKFKTLVVFKRDRLSRKFDQMMEIKRFFKKYGIRVIYSNQNEYQPKDDYISDFIENIIMAVDQLEPNSVSQRTAAGREKKRERGEYVSGGNLPFGFERTKDENDKIIYAPLEREAETVRYIFNRYLTTNDNDEMRDLLKAVNSRKAVKKPLTSQSILNMVKNPVYAGLQFVDTNKSIIDLFTLNTDTGKFRINKGLLHKCSNVEPIVNGRCWLKAALKWRKSYKPKSKPIESYLFKGLLVCDHCGKSVIFAANRYRCKSGCLSLTKDKVVSSIINTLANDICSGKDHELSLKCQAQTIRKEMDNLNRQRNIVHSELEKKLHQYVRNPNSEKLRDEIKSLSAREETLWDAARKYEEKLFKLNSCVKNIAGVKKALGKAEFLEYLRSHEQDVQELLSGLLEKVMLNGKNGYCEIEILKH